MRNWFIIFCFFPMMCDIINISNITLRFIFTPLFILQQSTILSYIYPIINGLMGIYYIEEM